MFRQLGHREIPSDTIGTYEPGTSTFQSNLDVNRRSHQSLAVAGLLARHLGALLARNEHFPPWPDGAFAELLASALLATVALAGSRLWWVSAFCASGSLVLWLFVMAA